VITLTMERLDHAVVLKLPTEHEHVMVALWWLGLNRDPHMYTLGELNAVFSYDAASCGVSDRVLWQMLKDGPHIKKVYICYDNDEPGQQAAQRISRALTEQNISNEIYAPVHKDWNEELLQKKKGKT